MSDNRSCPNRKIREAVCIDTNRVYDSCADKDCLANLRVYFPSAAQAVVDEAINVRVRDADVLNCIIDVERVPFNRGCYTCDITFFFRVTVDAYTQGSMNPTAISGISTFSKKCVLYGSEGNVKVFSSEFTSDGSDDQFIPTNTNPRARVQVAEPIALDAKLCRPDECCCNLSNTSFSLPRCITRAFTDEFPEDLFIRQTEQAVAVTLGIFSIVQLERDVQMLIPAYDFCIPSKECNCNTDDPCDAFRKINFPVDEFFPPNAENINNDSDGCGCSNDGCGCQ